jgi:hypothetical protein
MTTTNAASSIGTQRNTRATRTSKPKLVQTVSLREKTEDRTVNGIVGAIPPAVTEQAPKAPGKLDQLAALITGATGATIAEMMAATGWQAHSVRGAMAGALTKTRGLTIVSDKVDGVRTYRASAPVQSDTADGVGQ